MYCYCICSCCGRYVLVQFMPLLLLGCACVYVHSQMYECTFGCVSGVWWYTSVRVLLYTFFPLYLYECVWVFSLLVNFLCFLAFLLIFRPICLSLLFLSCGFSILNVRTPVGFCYLYHKFCKACSVVRVQLPSPLLKQTTSTWDNCLLCLWVIIIYKMFPFNLIIFAYGSCSNAKCAL